MMMGICLDTDANPNRPTIEQSNEWNELQRTKNPFGRQDSIANVSIMEMHNGGKIKFDPPKVPVIFVLGGPGSGKVTHCDTFMHEHRGITHINMMDLLQQYAMGNDMQDFSQLSSKTVTEVLMLEMKMAPAAKAYLISGYPRSMRDVVEYSEKIQIVSGVILISWRESILQKQIDYGAKLGHVVLSLAKMELENFFKNVMPVADYFDQSDMLIAVNGERSPLEVYKDFRAAALDILNSLENQEAILNGITGMGKGINDIPGSIVSVETAPSQVQTSDRVTAEIETISNKPEVKAISSIASNVANGAGTAIGLSAISKESRLNNRSGIPYVIWVIGGPGSNKATLCHKAVTLNAGWAHISVGRLLREITDAAPRANTENYNVKEALASGEMAPEKTVQALLEKYVKHYSDHTGIIIDGYPRNMQQVKYFEDKYKQQPIMILLDCSKLQLGRGRIDDTVSSFRRRLELFREQTLPMLKFMDNNSRLQIIDGDTDSPTVQKEFEKVIRLSIKKLTNTLAETKAPTNTNINSQIETGSQTDAILQDLESNTSDVVPTISHHISLMNGGLKNRQPSFMPMSMPNGDISGQNLNFRRMLQEAERHPVDSYI